MPCEYQHPVAADKFEMRLNNTIILHYNYMVYPKLGKGVFIIFRIPCSYPACVAQHDKYWLKIVFRNLNQGMNLLKTAAKTNYLTLTTIISSCNY